MTSGGKWMANRILTQMHVAQLRHPLLHPIQPALLSLKNKVVRK